VFTPWLRLGFSESTFFRISPWKQLLVDDSVRYPILFSRSLSPASNHFVPSPSQEFPVFGLSPSFWIERLQSPPLSLFLLWPLAQKPSLVFLSSFSKAVMSSVDLFPQTSFMESMSLHSHLSRALHTCSTKLPSRTPTNCFTSYEESILSKVSGCRMIFFFPSSRTVAVFPNLSTPRPHFTPYALK